MDSIRKTMKSIVAGKSSAKLDPDFAPATEPVQNQIEEERPPIGPPVRLAVVGAGQRGRVSSFIVCRVMTRSKGVIRRNMEDMLWIILNIVLFLLLPNLVLKRGNVWRKSINCPRTVFSATGRTCWQRPMLMTPLEKTLRILDMSTGWL
jgi:hypothetical protein